MLDLPGVRSMVGNATIDVMNYRQVMAIFNKLKYHPRPVIQGYSSYTPSLQTLNRSFFENNLRPEYLLFNLETIDRRFPALDDAPALLYVLKNYHPITSERGMFLFRKNEGVSVPVQQKLISEQTVRFGQMLDCRGINQTVLVMQVDMKPTILGSMVTSLYHAPIIPMDVYIDGGKITTRFVPAMAEIGFLFNPLLLENEDVINIYRKKGRPVTGVTFLKPEMAWGQLPETFTVRMYSIEL
jgi:hypothetical protein